MSERKKFNTRQEMEEETATWNANAAAYMRARAQNPDQIGYLLKFDEKAQVWYRYFLHKGMTGKAKNLRHQMYTGKTYIVPTEYPHQYDPSYKPEPYTFTKPPAPLGEQEMMKMRQRVSRMFREFADELGRGVRPLGQTKPFLTEVEERDMALRWLEDQKQNAKEEPLPKLSPYVQKQFGNLPEPI